ncbi:MAG: PAS domain S-box protein [Bacteroidetes bacterium]|nr:PAS domain S-box protein [Bacteroidota bacterium]
MKSLTLRYLVFITSVVLTIVVSQLFIQYDLNEQNSEAKLINLAGRQRMLSQRISKLTLFLQYNHVNRIDSSFYRLDTLEKLVSEWEGVHFQLIRQNELSSKSIAIDSLLKNNTPNLQQIALSCRQILKSHDSSTIRQAIRVIAKCESPFLLRMDRTVQTYQREAEQKLQFLKILELVLSSVAIVILVSGFVFIVMPGSSQLQVMNQQLVRRNSELVASQERIKSSMEQIKALQSELEVKQRQYEGLIDGASDFIYELDQDGKFSFINPLMEAKTGFSKEELVGKFYSELIYEDDVKTVVDFYDIQRRAQRAVSYLEFRIRTRNGSPLWVGQNVRMFFSESKPYKVSVVARDINRVKESQAALSLEKILVRTIIDNIPVNIYAKNLKSEKILVNLTECKYLGVQSEEYLIGKSDYDLYPEETAKISIEEDLRIFDGEVILNRETLNRRWDGSETWFLSSKVPLRNGSQEIIGLVGISIDISSQKKAKEELERSEKLYRLLAENSQDVISLHKLDGMFEYISPSSINLHGYYPHELIGRNGIDFVLQEDAEILRSEAPSILERMNRNESLEPSQFRIVTKNRGIVWVENLIKPLFEKGALSGFQSTVRDISARKAYEIALEKAKQGAEAATLAKSQFLSMMSHEIRTPMNGIMGITNILLSESPRPDQSENLELLQFSCKNLLTIINDILDFSKVEAGKMELEKVSFNLKDILLHYKKLHDHLASQKGIALKLIADEKIPATLLGDPVRIGQVLNNLLSNAIKFTEAGSVELMVTHHGIKDDLHQVKFSIKDTGIGIAGEKINSVSEGFNQASSDITRKFGGTGLGLAISKRFLALMNSSIQVESQLGVGSQFSFTLNLPEGIEILSVDYESNQAFLEQATEVLLVEDNKVNQLVAKRILETWGFIVTVAENGFEAIDEIESMKFHLVLMDIHMPGMTGYEATRIIRSKVGEYFKNIPIIALTADVSREIKEKSIASGMNDLMAKPFNPTELKVLIQKHVSNQSTGKNKNSSSTYVFPKLRLFAEGDLKFESELKILLVKSLRELEGVVKSALLGNSSSIDLDNILHKTGTTLNLINDQRINDLIVEVNKYISSVASSEGKNQHLIFDFESAVSDTVKKLEISS